MEKSFIYLYRSYWSFLYQKYIGRNTLGSVYLRELKTRPLSPSEALPYFRSTKSVLDISEITHNGLSLRTFKAIETHSNLTPTNQKLLSVIKSDNTQKEIDHN